MMTSTEAELRDYDRARIKAGLFSLFWAVISDRRKRGKYTMKEFAAAVGRDKSAVSRWFSDPPNWRLETAADIANALGIDVEFRARERATGRIFTSSGALDASANVRFNPTPSSATMSGRSAITYVPPLTVPSDTDRKVA